MLHRLMATSPDEFSSLLHAPSTGGDGASALPDAHLLLAQHQRKVRALVDNETGVRFESLALFADPLFELYDLDAGAAFELHASPDEADETTVAVMEAARLLWAYYSLTERERADRRGALTGFLAGPHATPEDEADLDALLDAVESHWNTLTDEDVELAEDVEAETLGFDALLEHPAFALPTGDPPSERTFGSDRLSEMEARALFAQPLLERVDDPDALETAMERADDYWTLAQLQGLERDVYLDEIVGANALDADEAAAIRAEAEEMILRFRTLFPDRA
jgi:hypothetical protein